MKRLDTQQAYIELPNKRLVPAALRAAAHPQIVRLVSVAMSLNSPQFSVQLMDHLALGTLEARS